MLNLHSAGLLYLKFDYALKYKKKLTLLNSLLSVGVFGLDFFSGQNGIGHWVLFFCLVAKWLRGALDQENTNFGSKNSKPDFYTIWEKRSWNIGKSWKKLKKVEKWPKNHYLATLGIYLQFHDFQSFSKKITEKILTAGCSNWWSQYVRKFNYFLNNIPKIILGGG